MKNSYFDTVTNFEKLKSLQNKIMRNTKEGKSTKSLQAVKHELEKDVIDKFKSMKDMSMQTLKLNDSETAPWMHAAQEIVNMLQSVRGENTEQMGAISKKMQEMVQNLERQAITIKSLTAELREKKEIVLKLTAENSDLSQDVTILRARYNKYEKDLRAAQQMIRQLHAQVEEKKGQIPEGQGKSLSESMSKMLAQFEPQPQLQTSTSDPSFLRTKLKECEETLESLREEFSRSSEEKAEMRQELEEKREYMNSIEEENEKLSKDIRRLRQEIRKSVEVPMAAQAPVIPTTNEHTSEHCKCHVEDNELEEEVANWKKDAGKWQAKCEYFKKCLADTEMKLSDAFREISDLRMERELPLPPPAAKVEQPKAMPSAKPSTKPSAKPTVENVEKERPLSAPKPKEPHAPKMPRKEVRARYMQKSNKVEKLPDFQTPTPVIPDEIKQDLTPGMSRELMLFQAGDMQGKLNMLSSDIMEFVSEIGQMLYEEKNEDKPPTGNSRRPVEARDNKDDEQKQKRDQVLFSGQHAVAKLREAYELLSRSLNLQHDEYEAMYRSYKMNNQRHMIRKAVMMGRLPISALQDISYGGKRGNKEDEIVTEF
ncbi:hypothetical protein MAR_014369 [Mya arenaria]|uniref:Uncharacterized protein n=1 Tax=Mya arenaria TaxID=6604 RepID=A0ABY7G3C5_MYAAR|nr:hypothetical protein MAR_014369 [Mya arenaria]